MSKIKLELGQAEIMVRVVSVTPRDREQEGQTLEVKFCSVFGEEGVKQEKRACPERQHSDVRMDEPSVFCHIASFWHWHVPDLNCVEE